MASYVQNPPPWINFLNQWGPKLLPGGTLCIFKGERVVSTTWKDPKQMIEYLKSFEKMEWAYSLPHQRQELFNRKLEILTKNLPLNWEVIICTTAYGVIIVIGTVSIITSQIAKL